ncbi:MAG: polysaccharide deacetylase family protein [Nitrospira sp.]|nr:polysaccharide deacetylase family protein [Nitrospira sp.]
MEGATTEMSWARNLYYHLLTFPGVDKLSRLVQRNCATVFMLHRFRHMGRGIEGFDVEHLRNGLEFLRKRKYDLRSLASVIESMMQGGTPLRGAVAFTIDDGYVDQAEVAAKVFADYDCPVTTFLATGFVDGKLWFWWDKIEFIFASTRRHAIRVRLADRLIDYHWDSMADRICAQADFTAKCKLVSDSDKHLAIASLAVEGEVLVPDVPPEIFSPMTWDQARDCERIGMTFGPHTVTHPILSRTTDVQAKDEIMESWKRVREELNSPVPIFCYPNGGWGDFGTRETDILKNAGLIGAVVGEPGFADPDLLARECAGPYKIRRFGFPETLPRLVQYVSGIERLKQKARREC